MTQQPRSAAFHVREDGGLASVLGSSAQMLARERILRDPEILNEVRDELRARLDRRYLDPFAPCEERNTEVARVLRQRISRDRQSGGRLASVPADEETLLALFAATLGWGPAQRYLDDPKVNEVKIVGRAIVVQEAGKPFVRVPETFATANEVYKRAVTLASLLDITLDGNTPQATLPVAHGTRMHVTIPPRVEEDGTLVCIRRGRRDAWDLEDVLKRGSLDQKVKQLLELFSRARCSFLVAGRTSSGKTGLLEALANSWPGDAHIVSIEDHTQEIGIRNDRLWTREMVNTQKDLREGAGPIGEFGRVATEALRQTPGLLLPGEIRGSEAGAILTLLLTDHPVITTIHARSCREAVDRFANCASLPSSFMYEGRRDDALKDACIGFDVVIKMDFWEEIGRRLITEVALVNGAVHEHGRWIPNLVPLVEIEALPNGELVWECAAEVGENGLLCWKDQSDRTPEPLKDKLKRVRAMAYAKMATTTLDVVQEAIRRADDYLLAGEAERAFATLSSAWALRQDGELLAAAQRALYQDREKFTLVEIEAQQAAEHLRRLSDSRRWEPALKLLQEITANLGIAALGAPKEGGWEAAEQRIRSGMELEQRAQLAIADAEIALAQGLPRVVISLLNPFQPADLPGELAITLLDTREKAQEALLSRQEGSLDVLNAIRSQRQAFERLRGAPPGADQ